jgi:hypothetical protein
MADLSTAGRLVFVNIPKCGRLLRGIRLYDVEAGQGIVGHYYIMVRMVYRTATTTFCYQIFSFRAHNDIDHWSVPQ